MPMAAATHAQASALRLTGGSSRAARCSSIGAATGAAAEGAVAAVAPRAAGESVPASARDVVGAGAEAVDRCIDERRSSVGGEHAAHTLQTVAAWELLSALRTRPDRLRRAANPARATASGVG
jgi:hypothetical protein